MIVAERKEEVTHVADTLCFHQTRGTRTCKLKVAQ